MMTRTASASVVLSAFALWLLALGPAACGSGDFQPSADNEKKSSDGQTCSAAGDCKSAHCVDGVCCDTPCAGKCEGCAIAGNEGVCTPYPSGDPDSDCVGANPECSGACDGKSACAFPDAQKSCGASECNAGVQTDQVCAGDGTCTSHQTQCGDFGCGASICITTCTTEADCTSNAYCKSGLCELKSSDGNTCGDAVECESGFCEDSICCAGACPAPGSCSSGACLCGGVACAAGSACILYHVDQDGDGYGMASANDKYGCAGTPPVGPSGEHYFPATDPQDCDDETADAHPGQLAFFTKSYGTAKNWDYDCNGTAELQYPSVQGGVCKACCSGSTCLQCTFGNWYLSCSPNVSAAYDDPAPVSCGLSKPFQSCSNYCQAKLTSNVPQGCR